MEIQLNAFAAGSLLLCLMCLFLAFITFRQAKSKIHKIVGSLIISVGLWGLFAFFIALTRDKTLSILLMRIAMLGVAFMPVFLFHITYLLSKSKNKYFLIFVYAQAAFFSILSVN